MSAWAGSNAGPTCPGLLFSASATTCVGKERAMTTYVVRRLVFLVPVVFLVSFITFYLIHLVPGNPAQVLLGEEATPQNVAALTKQLGLDKPLDRKSVV